MRNSVYFQNLMNATTGTTDSGVGALYTRYVKADISIEKLIAEAKRMKRRAYWTEVYLIHREANFDHEDSVRFANEAAGSR